MDWIGGKARIDFDGNVHRRFSDCSYPFDSVISSPSGRFVVVYERLGTKGYLSDRGKELREINRSYVYAGITPYPIVFLQLPDGREVLAHCPERHNQIEFEDALTGERLTTSGDRKPADYFQSGLAVSPGQTRLMSAGWFWHPIQTVRFWSISEALSDPGSLDSVARLPFSYNEINYAVFADEDRVILASDLEETGLFDEGEIPDLPLGHIALYNLRSNELESVTNVGQSMGAMMWLGADQIVSFSGHPKVIDVKSGEVLQRWPDVVTGYQPGALSGRGAQVVPLALDPVRKRFAVAAKDKISVIEFD